MATIATAALKQLVEDATLDDFHGVRADAQKKLHAIAVSLASELLKERGAVEQQPVAWRRMNKVQTASTGVTDVAAFADGWRKCGEIVEPLYTHPAAEEWHSMDTAPRDGTEILLWFGRPVCGHYSTDTLDPEVKGEGSFIPDITWPGMGEPTLWQKIRAPHGVELAKADSPSPAAAAAPATGNAALRREVEGLKIRHIGDQVQVEAELITVWNGAIDRCLELLKED